MTDIKELMVGILGNKNSGKTTLSIKIVTEKNTEENFETLDNFGKFIIFEQKNYFIKIKELNFSYDSFEKVSEMDGILLMYSVTDKTSFKDLALNLKPIKRNKDSKPMPVILVANKIDDEENREVSEISGRNLSKEMGGLYFECSAKNDPNLDLVLEKLIQLIEDTELKNYDKKEQQCFLM
eukprot:gene1906-1046_t